MAEKNEHGIENANSSGQGYHEDHHKHQYHHILTKHGYVYSHTTPIHTQPSYSDKRDTIELHHTYLHPKHKDHYVGVGRKQGHVTYWTAGKLGSGHKFGPHYHESHLDRYLNKKHSKKLHEETMADTKLTNIINNAFSETPEDFRVAVNEMIQTKALDALEGKKISIAKSFFGQGVVKEEGDPLNDSAKHLPGATAMPPYKVSAFEEGDPAQDKAHVQGMKPYKLPKTQSTLPTKGITPKNEEAPDEIASGSSKTKAFDEENLDEKYLGFKKLEKKVATGGATNPGAVAAAIGRKKYGKKKFQKAAATGTKLKGK